MQNWKKQLQKSNISTNNEELTAQGEVLKFEGFLKVYREDRDEDDITEEEQEGMLPPLVVGQKLPLKEMKATERFSRPLPRYHGSITGKKTGRTGNWPAFNLCTYHFNDLEKRLCREKR